MQQSLSQAIDKARDALKVYFNESVKWGYKQSFDQLIESLGDKSQQQMIMKNIGDIIFSLNLSSDDIKMSMTALANRTKGIPPTQKSLYGIYLNNMASDKIQQMQAEAELSPITQRIVDIGQGFAEAAENAGAAVGNTLSVARWALPVILIGALAFVVFSKAKRVSA